jgi:hypothetical protein
MPDDPYTLDLSPECMVFVLGQLSPAELSVFRELKARRGYWTDYQMFQPLAPNPDGSPSGGVLDAEAYRLLGIAVPDWFAAFPPDPERDLRAAIERHVKSYHRRRWDGVASEGPPPEQPVNPAGVPETLTEPAAVAPPGRPETPPPPPQEPPDNPASPPEPTPAATPLGMPETDDRRNLADWWVEQNPDMSQLKLWCTWNAFSGTPRIGQRQFITGRAPGRPKKR